MEEMAKEKKVKEESEKAEKEKLKKIDSQFENPAAEWSKEKKMFEDLAEKANQLAKVEADKKRTPLEKKIDQE
jgi:hypothetical protein